MSNTDFPMPKTVEMPRTNAAPPVSDYALRRGLGAVAEAIAADPPPYTRPASDYKTPKHTDAIKDSLKRLTHREMRELVEALFEAHKALGAQDVHDKAGPGILLGHMADVLDRFAYGE